MLLLSRVRTDAPPGDQQRRLPAADGHDCSAEERRDLRDGHIPGAAQSQGGLRRVHSHLPQRPGRLRRTRPRL